MRSDDQPNLTDEFDLLYTRGVAGWSDLYVVASHTQIAVGITHIASDPIAELSELCCNLLRGEPQCMARLLDEPGATVVAASVYPTQKHLAHVEFWSCRSWDDSPPCGTSILSADVKVRQFVGLVYRQFEKVRWLYEEPNYQKRRDQFPHVAFETLQRLWMDSSR